MSTILVPVDTSDAARPVVAEATKLAVLIKARVVLLHVIEPVANFAPGGATVDLIAAPPEPGDMEDSSFAMARLESLSGPIRSHGLEVECETSVGLAVSEISDRARDLPADYIVLGSHGHGALFHLFSGSVVTGVLKHATCPVMVVPAQNHRPTHD